MGVAVKVGQFRQNGRTTSEQVNIGLKNIKKISLGKYHHNLVRLLDKKAKLLNIIFLNKK